MSLEYSPEKSLEERYREAVERIAQLERLLKEQTNLNAARQADSELAAIFAALSDIILVIDSEGRYLKVAPTGPELLYKPSNELLGRTVSEVLPPDFAAEFLAHVKKATKTQTIVNIEYSLNLRGSEVWFLGAISPMSEDRVVFVGRDITDRRLAEQKIQSQQAALIRAQAAALAELSTPLIPISDDVVVMPLIGTIDAHRASQVMTTLLSGITDRRARVAILDITGVSKVDSQIANALINTARAARMLGAQVVLTGISSELAHTFVSLGTDFQDIVTRSTLQAGISFAIGKALK